MDFNGAFSQLGLKLQRWFDSFVLLLPNLMAALIVLVLFWILARLVRRLVRGLTARATPSVQVRNLFGTLAYVLVLIAGVSVALGVLGLDKTVASLLAGAGIVGLGAAFALKDIAANFLSGVLLTMRHPYRIGDLIETNDYLGTVHTASLSSLELLTPTGQVILIPNKLVYETPIINYTRLGERRVDLKIGVAHAEDLDRAKRIALEAVEAVSTLSPGHEVQLFYEEVGDSSITFVVRFWVPFKKQADFLGARSEAIERVKAAFDAAGIRLPLPSQTLFLAAPAAEALGKELEARRSR
jgi:small conductance mechanosensitive channel